MAKTRPFMNPLSAAVMIAAWIDAHGGLRPQARECRNKNGLPHHATLYRMFASASSFGQIIACAEKIARTSYASTSPYGKIRTCIGRDSVGRECTNTFIDVGAEQRLCERCRYRTSLYAKHESFTSIDVSVQSVGLERWGRHIHSVEETINF